MSRSEMDNLSAFFSPTISTAEEEDTMIDHIAGPQSAEECAYWLLRQQWGRIYTWLIDCTQGKSTGWYIDDRADPTNFKNVLSWAHPELAQKIFGKRYNKTVKGLTYIKRNLDRDDDDCPTC